MNELLETMAKDMDIHCYLYEPNSSYTYRLLFSALGQWCLRLAASPDKGISKQSQTIILNNLLEKYLALFPEVKSMFESETIPAVVFIRRVYEELGYMFTDVDNKNHVSNFGKCIKVENCNIYFGIIEPASIYGLGVITTDYAPLEIDWKEILIRDELTWDWFVSKQYDIVLFEDKDIPIDELQFFDPLSANSPSNSWKSQMTTDKTIARKTINGPFYKIMRINGEFLFCEVQQNKNQDELISYDYRRLYFSLRKYYGNPLITSIKKIDEEYSELIVGGHLPNREYYLLLLCGWPYRNVFNKNMFIIKNKTIVLIRNVLNNLGIEIKGV